MEKHQAEQRTPAMEDIKPITIANETNKENEVEKLDEESIINYSDAEKNLSDLLDHLEEINKALRPPDMSNKAEQAELNDLWSTLQVLSDKEQIKREAKELMMTDETLLKQKENDLEVLIVRLKMDEEEIQTKSRTMKLLQGKL